MCRYIIDIIRLHSVMGSEAKIREWGVLIGWCPLDCYDYYRVSKN